LFFYLFVLSIPGHHSSSYTAAMMGEVHRAKALLGKTRNRNSSEISGIAGKILDWKKCRNS